MIFIILLLFTINLLFKFLIFANSFLELFLKIINFFDILITNFFFNYNYNLLV